MGKEFAFQHTRNSRILETLEKLEEIEGAGAGGMRAGGTQRGRKT
jgi:hypothetical protein